MGAAASSALGRAGTARRGAHMGASIVVELSWMNELRLRGDGGKKNQLQLEDCHLPKDGNANMFHALLSAGGRNIDPCWVE